MPVRVRNLERRESGGAICALQKLGSLDEILFDRLEISMMIWTAVVVVYQVACELCMEFGGWVIWCVCWATWERWSCAMFGLVGWLADLALVSRPWGVKAWWVGLCETKYCCDLIKSEQ